jgi:Subtilase family
MGVMVGGDAGGSSVGIAPDATWIAVKIFNDRGTATSSGIHQGFQWLLDPDGNPATADAPDVVNDSWTMSTSGCLLDFQPDLANLRTAGVLPVFAAGNYGPLSGSARSPANNPEAFAVGATNDMDAIYSYSSRGPSHAASRSIPNLWRPASEYTPRTSMGCTPTPPARRSRRLTSRVCWLSCCRPSPAYRQIGRRQRLRTVRSTSGP